MKSKDKKKLLQIIKNFEKLKKEHKEKVEKEGKNYAVLGYWKKQIEKFDEEIRRHKQRLKDE